MIDSKEAKAVVATFQALLDKTPPEATAVHLSPESWTLTEFVGHLNDSAGINHQRFARLLLGNLEGLPGYEAEAWVAAQGYAACDFKMLANLWTSYNAFLLGLIASMPAAALQNVWTRPDGVKMPLENVIDKYFDHIRLHTKDYTERMAAVQARLGQS
jgi:hypothetical protein